MVGIFDPKSEAGVTKLVAEYPFAWIVSRNFQATPLPLLGEADGSGRIVSLLGHFALSNPHVAALQTDPAALILVQGAQGYISPQLVSNPTWGPTWNYAVARFEVEIEFLPDLTEYAIDQLAKKLEGTDGDAWSPKKNMADRYDVLRQRIIAFRAHVRKAHATFKLGQDESAETFGEIVSGLNDPDLARWMSAEREG